MNKNGYDSLNDSINQRDLSVDVLRQNDYVDQRTASMKNDYSSYVNNIGNSIKHKKTRVELERDKQMNNQVEVGMAQLLINSKSNQDHQRKQYVRDITNSPNRIGTGIHNSVSPMIGNNKAKGLNMSGQLDQSPFSNNAKMILGEYGMPQQQYHMQNQNIKPQTPLISQQAFQVMQPIASQQFLSNFIPPQAGMNNNQMNLPINQSPQILQPTIQQQNNMMPNDQQQNFPQQQFAQQQSSVNLNASIGPPSGMQFGIQNQDNYPNDSNFKPQESFKNPWVTVSRPMNGFMDINPVHYERQEKEKMDLQRILQDQIEEKKRRQEEDKRKLILEEQYYEQKLAKDRMELAMKEKLEKQMQQNKFQKIQEQNEKLHQFAKVEPKQKRRPISPIMEAPPPQQIEQFTQQTTQLSNQEHQQQNTQQPQQQVPQKQNFDDEQLKKELKDLSSTFKGELDQMRQVIKNQDGSLKQEVNKILDYQKQTEQERNSTINEIQKLRQEFLRQQDMKQEQQWEQLSRGAHWAKYKDDSKPARRIIESEVKLKTILTDGYFGQDGVLKSKRIIDSQRQKQQLNKSLEPFYQSSKMMDLSNFAINKKDDQDAEAIRDKNIDRLKFLQQYEDTLKYKQGFQYFKNSEEEEEKLSLRLKKLDTYCQKYKLKIYFIFELKFIRMIQLSNNYIEQQTRNQIEQDKDMSPIIQILLMILMVSSKNQFLIQNKRLGSFHIEDLLENNSYSDEEYKFEQEGIMLDTDNPNNQSCAEKESFTKKVALFSKSEHKSKFCNTNILVNDELEHQDNFFDNKIQAYNMLKDIDLY